MKLLISLHLHISSLLNLLLQKLYVILGKVINCPIIIGSVDELTFAITFKFAKKRLLLITSSVALLRVELIKKSLLYL
jgi:hypothetical protein